MEKICVLGAGSWGTALAIVVAKKGYDVSMWTLSEDQCKKVNNTRENTDYLPGVSIPQNIIIIKGTLIPTMYFHVLSLYKKPFLADISSLRIILSLQESFLSKFFFESSLI